MTETKTQTKKQEIFEGLIDLAYRASESAYRISGDIHSKAGAAYASENSENLELFSELADALILAEIETDLEADEILELESDWKNLADEIHTGINNFLNELDDEKSDAKKKDALSETDMAFLEGFDEALNFLKKMNEKHPGNFFTESLQDSYETIRGMHLTTFKTIAKIKSEK